MGSIKAMQWRTEYALPSGTYTAPCTNPALGRVVVALSDNDDGGVGLTLTLHGNGRKLHVGSFHPSAFAEACDIAARINALGIDWDAHITAPGGEASWTPDTRALLWPLLEEATAVVSESWGCEVDQW